MFFNLHRYTVSSLVSPFSQFVFSQYHWRQETERLYSLNLEANRRTNYCTCWLPHFEIRCVKSVVWFVKSTTKNVVLIHQSDIKFFSPSSVPLSLLYPFPPFCPATVPLSTSSICLWSFKVSVKMHFVCLF